VKKSPIRSHVGKRYFREGNARFLGAFRNFARPSRPATLGPLITPERTRILRKRSPVIWVDKVGRNPIIGCVGKIGKIVRFSKLYGSCVTEGLRILMRLAMWDQFVRKASPAWRLWRASGG